MIYKPLFMIRNRYLCTHVFRCAGKLSAQWYKGTETIGCRPWGPRDPPARPPSPYFWIVLFLLERYGKILFVLFFKKEVFMAKMRFSKIIV